MQQQINALAERVAGLTSTQTANHAENRRDITRLANAQQDLLDALTAGLERIGDKIGGRITLIDDRVTNLRLQFARAMGYAAGMAAVAVFIFEVAKSIIEKGMK